LDPGELKNLMNTEEGEQILKELSSIMEARSTIRT
jgi:hypothetical protein